MEGEKKGLTEKRRADSYFLMCPLSARRFSYD